MIKKLQLYINLVIILMVVCGIVYFIVTNVIELFKKPEKIEMAKIKSELITDNMVTDYNTTYALDAAISNFIEYCSAENYNSLYKIMDSEYKRAYSKVEVTKKLQEYKENYFTSIDPDNLYESSSKIINAYTYKGIYIVIFRGANNQNIYMGINLNMSTYTYTFAFVEN